MFTLRDIQEELRKPGRDPRDKFIAPQFQAGINEIKDLTPRAEGKEVRVAVSTVEEHVHAVNLNGIGRREMVPRNAARCQSQGIGQSDRPIQGA